MSKKALTFMFAASLLAVGVAAYAEHGAIFEETVFAPIQPGGMIITLEPVATGLTSPLKGVVAPGLPDSLFVVDQPGIIWAIDLSSPGPVACPGSGCQVFLDVSAQLVSLGVLGPGTFDERGLLGLAFDPDYVTNGLLYTYTSEPLKGKPDFASTLPSGKRKADHQNVVAKWQVPDPTNPASVVDPVSRRELMRVDWPQFNNNGGDLAFGTDDMLYVSMGDGGGADDRDGQEFIVAGPIIGHGLDGNAQNLTNPLGKILRIDVAGSNSANRQYGIPDDNPFVDAGESIVEEIFAYGLRNPYRFSFDTDSGDLYVGNVGQNDLEEVELVTSGANHGWPIKEGTEFFNHNELDEGFACDPDDGPFPCPVVEGDFVDPIAQYDTHEEGHSVIGGFVYRGSKIPKLEGRYVFGDFSAELNFPSGPNNFGRLFYLEKKKTTLVTLLSIQQKETLEMLLNIQEFTFTGQDVLDLALLGIRQDAGGELYVLGNIKGVPFDTDGVVLRLAPGKK